MSESQPQAPAPIVPGVPPSTEPSLGGSIGADASIDTGSVPTIPGAPAGETRGLALGTAPVFLASVSTILGAVLFLRFGYAVGHTGLLGALAIILLGHLVTVPTSLAIAEIATNRRVEGGGEYFIISRSFGATIGGAIGISLYLSQAISVAFYVIAFAEAFQPLAPRISELLGIPFDPRFVSMPALLLLLILMLTRGADIGVKALWVVASILGVSLLLFFLGSPVGEMAGEAGGAASLELAARVPDADPFILVFAIVFPAFTGMTAGVGLSGDLANPRRSIPLGILSATVFGMLMYVAIVFKLSLSAPPEILAGDQLVMSRIALWGPIIPIGLACATLSSAIGSILVAPRTLQALAYDRILPSRRLNGMLARGVGAANEPRNATLITGVLAIITVAGGNVDFVARIISMFFMVTYGALCAISALEHFAARPSYRPSFRSKWYLSLLGAVLCFLLMFQMDPLFAVLAIAVMALLYHGIRKGRGDGGDLGVIFQGVMAQANRFIQVKLQVSGQGNRGEQWRPSAIAIHSHSFERAAPLQFFTWLCHRYGFGTYLHFIKGPLDPQTVNESREILEQLIRVNQARRSSVYVDTIISPSMRSALAQSVQLPGISGVENNTVLFEFSIHDDADAIDEILDGSHLTSVTHMNSLVLRHGEYFFGNRASIHIWLTWHDYRNANLMILLAYILLAHPDWHHAQICVFAAFPRQEADMQVARLRGMVSDGRLPISERNLRIFPTDSPEGFEELVLQQSRAADLVVLGFTQKRLQRKGAELLQRFPLLRDVLFVSAEEQVLIE